MYLVECVGAGEGTGAVEKVSRGFLGLPSWALLGSPGFSLRLCLVSWLVTTPCWLPWKVALLGSCFFRRGWPFALRNTRLREKGGWLFTLRNTSLREEGVGRLGSERLSSCLKGKDVF